MHAQYKEQYHAYIVPFPFTKLLLTASLDQNVHEFIYCKKRFNVWQGTSRG